MDDPLHIDPGSVNLTSIKIESTEHELGTRSGQHTDKSTQTVTMSPMTGEKSPQHVNVNSIVDLLNWLETCGIIIVTEDDADLICTKIYRFYSGYEKDESSPTKSEEVGANTENTKDCSLFSLVSDLKYEPEDGEGTISAEEFHTSADLSLEEHTHENRTSVLVPLPTPPSFDNFQIPEPIVVNTPQIDSNSTTWTRIWNLVTKTKDADTAGCHDDVKPSLPISVTMPTNLKTYSVKQKPPPQRSKANPTEKPEAQGQSQVTRISMNTIVSKAILANPVIPDDRDIDGNSQDYCIDYCNQISGNNDEASDPVGKMCCEDYTQELRRGIENPRLPPPDPTVILPKPLPASYYLKKLDKLNGRPNPNVPQFKCDVCGKVFKLNCNLKMHMETHLNLKNYCETCGKSFNQKQALRAHILSHIEKKYLCDKCPKVFANSSGLGKHQLSHTGEKSAVCPVCKKSFRNRRSLRDHSVVHSNERPFRCTICPKTFKRKDYLVAHVRIHTGDKRYKCEPCGRSFVQLGSLMFHNRTHHGIVKQNDSKDVYSE